MVVTMLNLIPVK